MLNFKKIIIFCMMLGVSNVITSACKAGYIEEVIETLYTDEGLRNFDISPFKDQLPVILALPQNVHIKFMERWEELNQQDQQVPVENSDNMILDDESENIVQIKKINPFKRAFHHSWFEYENGPNVEYLSTIIQKYEIPHVKYVLNDNIPEQMRFKSIHSKALGLLLVKSKHTLKSFSVKNMAFKPIDCKKIAGFQNLETLNLISMKFDPDSFKEIYKAPKLMKLNLSQTNISSEEIQGLFCMNNLIALDLSENIVSKNIDLDFLNKHKLTVLKILTSNDIFLNTIAKMPNLRFLDIESYSNNALNIIGRMTNLENLTIRTRVDFRDSEAVQGIEKLESISNLKNLKKLSINFCKNGTWFFNGNELIRCFNGLNNLQELSILCNEMKDQDAELIINNLPQLNYIELNTYNKMLSDIFIQKIKENRPNLIIKQSQLNLDFKGQKWGN
ncbi:MAG: hypothetical protein Q8L85_02495 [Alphaproteobacteria bacterium]|nr:hypothetical protein [Alphaproteobacteria bacterium]